MNSAFSRKRKGNIKFMSNVNGNGQQYIKKRIYGHVDPLSMENMYIRVVRSESSLDPEKGRPRIMRTTASYNKLWKYLSKAVSAFRICLVVNCLSRQFLSNCFPPIYLFQTASMWERERERKRKSWIFLFHLYSIIDKHLHAQRGCCPSHSPSDWQYLMLSPSVSW